MTDSSDFVRFLAQLFSPHFTLPAGRLLALCLLFASPGLVAQQSSGVAAPAASGVAAPALSGVASPATAAKASSGRVYVIEVRGVIRQELVPKLRAALEAIDADRFPAGAIILLDSQGGDGLVAMEVGRIVRAAKAHVFVRGRCASACVFVLAAGVVRGVAADRVVGIHRPRLTAFVKGLGSVDINAATNAKAAAVLEEGNRQAQEYLSEMGMPETLFKAMMAAPSDQTRYLSLEEMSAYGLLGIEPGYRLAQAPVANARFRISADDYVQRTSLVAEKCLGDATSAPQEIVRCYRRVLRTGE